MRLLGIAILMAAIAAVGAVLNAGAGAGKPVEPPSMPEAASEPSIDADLEKILQRSRPLIDQGLDELARRQSDDGSFGDENSRDVRLGVSAIAALAFLADGNTEDRGRHAESTARAIRFLQSCAGSEGERKGFLRAPGDTSSRMHGHALATLALTQAHGMFGVKRRHAGTADELKSQIHDAVSIIVRSQSRSGGWGYDPLDMSVDEGSITVCAVQALRAARDAGFYVPKRVIDDALDYVRRSQNSDGSVRYRLFGNEQSSFELTAAACSTLAYGGAYQDASVRRARDWLWGAHFDGFQAAESTFPYYGNFYAVQTLWFDYDYDRMARYYPRIVDWFESRFDPEAHVYRAEAMQIHKESLYGELYRLAFATLTLLVPFEQLPIFQR